ncbi:DUF1097 domain-containing protein [Burkholderia sp. Bp8989]|nr:DUF1097 domain-containing protein [Burkholderia sp. Bp8995]RQS51707.1 DUF1097 domain-containing protein [Burkholderia sp. Bp8989]
MMQPIVAYALAGSVISSVAVWAFLQYPGLLVWAAFIGWASLHHCGGGALALRKSVSCNTFGVVTAWAVALLVVHGLIPLPVPISAALWVALATPFVILMSRVNALDAVPSSFYGFASTFAYLVQTPGKFSIETMSTLRLDNALIAVTASLIIGNILGYLQVLMGNALIKRFHHQEPAIEIVGH